MQTQTSKIALNPLTRREFLKEAARTTAAVGALASISSVAPTLGAASETPRKSRISYYCNGEIYVTVPGEPEGKPLTTGHWDFKPSWSKTGDMLVCFRRLKDDPNVMNWVTAAFTINADGTGFNQMSDGTFTDFNPTWTRDGQNTPLWNRKNPNPKGRGFVVMQSRVGGKPGEEEPITEATFHNWAHSCLTDGRILVTAAPPKQAPGIFFLTRRPGPKPTYERIACELVGKGNFARMSISPSEKKICFEYITYEHAKLYKTGEPGHTLYLGDLDVEKRTITNLKPFANAEAKGVWFAYARWIDGESAIVYHSTQLGKGQLFVYQLEDGKTRRVSTNLKADYRYPHGEAAPC